MFTHTTQKSFPTSTPYKRIICLVLLILITGIFIVNSAYTLQIVSVGGALIGSLSGALGCFAALRRQSLLSDAVSHAALPGVCAAFFLAGKNLSFMLIGALCTSILGLIFIRLLTSTTPFKTDSAIGITIAAWFAAGIALLTRIQSMPNASQAGLDNFIFGQAAAIAATDLLFMAGISFVIFITLLLFWKEFKVITFDPAFAANCGIHARIFDALLFGLIIVSVVISLRMVGIILTVAVFIAPGTAARQWTKSLESMVILAAVFGAAAGVSGALLSAVETNMPTGPIIIIIAFLFVLLSLLFAPARGLLWKKRRQRIRQ